MGEKVLLRGSHVIAEAAVRSGCRFYFGYPITPQNELTEYMNQVKANSIIVSNEVGLGLVPVNSMSRLYRDFLGKANQMLARQADEVFLMVAGLPFLIKPCRNQW